jgi:hypothetical protein
MLFIQYYTPWRVSADHVAFSPQTATSLPADPPETHPELFYGSGSEMNDKPFTDYVTIQLNAGNDSNRQTVTIQQCPRLR